MSATMLVNGGKGFVLAISKRWPQPKAEFLNLHARQSLKLGAVQLVRVEKTIWVANMVAHRDIVVRLVAALGPFDCHDPQPTITVMYPYLDYDPFPLQDESSMNQTPDTPTRSTPAPSNESACNDNDTLEKEPAYIVTPRWLFLTLIGITMFEAAVLFFLSQTGTAEQMLTGPHIIRVDANNKCLAMLAARGPGIPVNI
jgi:hypothetical protein